MLISKTYAQEVLTDAAGEMAVTVGGAAAQAPSAAGAFAWNMGLIPILVVMFYLLLIRPQQKRFQQHKAMLDALKKGDRIVTSGGLVGKIDKLTNDEEVLVDLGNGIKVTALRATIQSTADSATAAKADIAEKKEAAANKASDKK